MVPTLIKATAASEQIGISVAVLRAWERKGLIDVIRSHDGKKLYDVKQYMPEYALHGRTTQIKTAPEFYRPSPENFIYKKYTEL